MKYRPLIALCCAVLVIAASWPGGAVHARSTAAKAPVLGTFYLALGDSLSVGYQPPIARESWTHGWVYLFRDMLNTIHPVELQNLAIRGECSFTLIKGDNYGMGVSAGHYIGKKLKGKPDAVIAEIAGIDTLQLTKDRSKGFADTLATYGLKVSNRVAAQFTVDSGQAVTANLLQAAPKIDAIWNHDDDQGVGVLAAIKQAGRKEFFMVGGAGSLDAMDHIKSGDTPLECTVTYPPTMASSAISLARLIAQGKGMDDLVELQVPKLIVLQSETVTKDNVDRYRPLGFKS